MRQAWFAVLLTAMACHRPREMAPQIPLAGVDGKYTFTIAQPFKLVGRFLVTYSEAYMIEPKYCVPTEGPRSSDALRATWFECRAGRDARPSESSLRLRISANDPIHQSRWYERVQVNDTVQRCTAWENGQCVQGFRAVRRERRWVDRSGAITVMKGWPAEPDTIRTPTPSLPRPLRTRCDTVAARGACQPNDNPGGR